MEVVPTQNIAGDQEMTTEHLAKLMNEYLAIKKVERDNIIADLHPEVRKRVYAIKNLLLETSKLDVMFHREVSELERKFQPKHDELFLKRLAITNGTYQPTNEESSLPGVSMNFETNTGDNVGPSGIPNFWLTVIRNVHEMKTTIQEADEPVLKHLIDIRAKLSSPPDLSFTLEFHFSPNEFLEDSVLSKTYLMKCCVDEDDPFSFEGPEIYKAIGCEIKWKEGKNVIETGALSSQLPFFKFDSFFNFFNPPLLEAEISEDNEKIEDYLETDFEIGHYLKERVIPRAVLFFTGEADDEMSEVDDNFGLDLVGEEEDGEKENIAAAGDN